MGIIRASKMSDAFEWRMMHKVFSREEIISKVIKDRFTSVRDKMLSDKDREVVYNICYDYYNDNKGKSDLYKKYPRYSKNFINMAIHRVIQWWQSGVSSRVFKYDTLSVQDAYLQESILPKVYFGSKDDYHAQRSKYILSNEFLKPNKLGAELMLYSYYIYGQSLDKLLDSKEDVVNFYNVCKRCGFISNVTIKDFASLTSYGDEAEEVIKSEGLQRVQEIQKKIESIEKQISLLKDELNSCKAEKRMLYKSMDMEEDGLYVQTSFL